METLLESFRQKVEEERIERLKREGLGCQANLENSKATIKKGRNYTKVDVGRSGFVMIDNSTMEIFGIKAYGQINRKKQYGTLKTIDDWYWGYYSPLLKKTQ